VRNDNETAATSDLISAQDTELDDFFSFEVEKIGAPGEELEGAAVRYRVRAELGGRRFEDVIVDIAFPDPLKWEPERIVGSDLLEFAGIKPIEVPVLPLEQHIAEKVHAYARTYSRGRGSSRAKDLVDIVLVKQSMVLDASRLRMALVGVFEKRRQHQLPGRLPPPPRDWVVPYRKMATEVGVNSDLRTGYAEAAALLDPDTRRPHGRTVGPEGRSVDVASLFDYRRDRCAQFCALCARICALFPCQRVPLASARTHLPRMQKLLLPQGFA